MTSEWGNRLVGGEPYRTMLVTDAATGQRLGTINVPVGDDPDLPDTAVVSRAIAALRESCGGGP